LRFRFSDLIFSSSHSYDSNSGGEREIQRTMLELLTQLDGFDNRGDIKVIMATNRIDSLDPALLRPGRIDRKIEFPAPDAKTKRMVFNIHTSKMSLMPGAFYLFIISSFSFVFTDDLIRWRRRGSGGVRHDQR
jgi:ATP-dependent 26S proteasome regulatory subunit